MIHHIWQFLGPPPPWLSFRIRLSSVGLVLAGWPNRFRGRQSEPLTKWSNMQSCGVPWGSRNPLLDKFIHPSDGAKHPEYPEYPRTTDSGTHDAVCFLRHLSLAWSQDFTISYGDCLRPMNKVKGSGDLPSSSYSSGNFSISSRICKTYSTKTVCDVFWESSHIGIWNTYLLWSILIWQTLNLLDQGTNIPRTLSPSKGEIKWAFHPTSEICSFYIGAYTFRKKINVTPWISGSLNSENVRWGSVNTRLHKRYTPL